MVGKTNPEAALTSALLEEYSFLEQNCHLTIQYETLKSNEETAKTLRQSDEAKDFRRKRDAMNYTPPQGITMVSFHERLTALERKIQSRHATLRTSLTKSLHIDYAVACINHLEVVTDLLSECAAALPAKFGTHNVFRNIFLGELRTVSWDELRGSSTNSVLGQGNFGRVVRLTWQHQGESIPVAVKVMSETFAGYMQRDYAKALADARKEAMTIHEIGARGGEALSSFVIQVYGFVTGSLPAHIQPVLQGTTVGEQAYGILMRLEAGGSVQQLLHPKAPIPQMPLTTLQKIRLVELAVRGLTELHRLGVVHGDFKPENTLLTEDDPPDVRIADFGLSAIRDVDGIASLGATTMQMTDHPAGTPLYSAPEMLKVNADGKVAKASRSTDVFAFGITMHQILSRAIPYENLGLNLKQLEDSVCNDVRPDLTLLPSDTPPSVLALIQKCWDGNRHNRPTAAECLATITHAHSILNSKEFDVFYSHRWGDEKNKKFLTYVCFLLRREGYVTWFDVDHMGHNLEASMKEGIARSKVMVACVDSGYQGRPNCMLELRHARLDLSPPKTVVTVITQPDIMTWGSPELKSLCGVPANPVLDISESAALGGWDALDGPTDVMKERVEKEVRELVKMLKAVGCEPSLCK